MFLPYRLQINCSRDFQSIHISKDIEPMTAVRSKRGDAASHLSDQFLVQHRQKRNAKGIGDQGMYMIDLVCAL